MDISNSLRIHQSSSNVNSGNGKSLNRKSTGKGRRTSNSKHKEELTPKPNYEHSTLFTTQYGSMYPFYTPKITKQPNDMIDYTACAQFGKNPIRKYSKPLEITSGGVSTASSLKNNSMFGPLGKNGEVDPIMPMFLHLPTESRLKFGYLQIDIDAFGKVHTKQLPQTSTTAPSTPIKTANKEAAAMRQLETAVEDLSIGSHPRPASSSSPRKRHSPMKVNPLLTILQNPFQPERPQLQAQQQQLFPVQKKTRKHGKSKFRSSSKYANFDRSMNLSSKAIMRLVDESLVSSDTELYSMMSMTRDEETEAGPAVTISADEIAGALQGLTV